MDTARLTSPHFIVGIALFGAVLAVLFFAGNPALRRRLRMTLGLVAAALAAHLGAMGMPISPGFVGDLFTLEKLLLTLGGTHAVVTLLCHPWSSDHATERVPGIMQGALVTGVFLAVVTLVFPEQLFAASAVGAVVVGFALQDTLGNFFAGLALQIDRPFKPGHWIEVGPYQGRVTEITWRATRIQTKAGNVVIVPNNLVGKDAITNYSVPRAPLRLSVDVGAGYHVPPNLVREAITAALERCPRVLASPKADVLLADFGASALIFRARFWIQDFEFDDPVRNEVRTAIYYEFHRREIEIPWPIQMEYRREYVPKDLDEARRRFLLQIQAAPIFASLGPDVHLALAAAAHERLFGRGEVVVKEDDPGESMFLVTAGAVAIAVGPELREVAVTGPGDYFGEMSLLTGDPRSATVIAKGDCTLIEISANAFGEHVRSHPGVLDALATAALARRQALEMMKTTPDVTRAPTASSLLARMRKFFKLA